MQHSRSFHLSLGILLIAVLLLTFSININTQTTGYQTETGFDIAINNKPTNSYSFVSESSEAANFISYKLDTSEDDNIDIRYVKDEEDNSELMIVNAPGSVDQVSFLERIDKPEKIDSALLNQEFLEKEGYLKDGRVPVIVRLKSLSGIQFASVRDKFKEDLSQVLNLNYYLIKDLDFVDSVTMDIELEQIPELIKLDTVNKVYLNKKVEAILDVSVPLINANDLWPLTDSRGENLTGKGTSIAIIDTGVDYTHADLGGCFGPKCKVVDGYDFINGDANPMDDHGHGTHVAATSAGNGKLKGVAPDAKIYAYKVLSYSGSGTFEGVINGIKRAVDPNNDGNTSDHVDIISMSLGGFGDEDSPTSLAVDQAVEAGVIVVSAAGNSGSSAGAIGTPGAARKGISVAATDKLDKLASFSSRGPTTKNNLKPDLSAPGVNICAAEWDNWLTASRCIDSQHIAISGTSMATPHVSGAAALLKQLHPEWKPEKIKSVLMSTAKDLNLKPWEQGTGRIDVLEASKAEITTNPQSISLGLILSNEVSQDIEIENIGEDVEISIDPGQAIDETGKKYNIANVDKPSLSLKAGEKQNVKFVLNLQSDLEGRFYGYIKITSKQRTYRIPYYFSKLTGLAVQVVDGSKKLAPYTIALRSSDLSVRKYATRFWEFSDNVYSFEVKGGNYTVFAIGDYLNKTMKYILYDSIYLEPGTSNTVKLDLSKARKLKPSTTTLDGRKMVLDQVGVMIKETLGYKTFAAGLLFLRTNLDDVDFYFSDTKDKTEKDITTWLVGYPKRENRDFLSDFVEQTYSGGDSLYYLYWAFNNISESTSSNLTFSKDELAEYKLKYNIPGADPNIGASDYGQSYMAVDFWTNPASVISASFGKRPPLPSEKTAYVKIGKFSLDNYPTINYLHFPQSIKEFAAQTGQREHDIKSNRLYWPLGVTPKTAEKRTIEYGSPPYIPTYFENSDYYITLNKYLAKGKETFIFKKPSVSYWSTTGASGTFDLPRPTVKVYVDDLLGREQQINWDTFYYYHYSSSNPQFRVELTIPVSYDIPNTVKMTGKFKLKQDDRNPPHLESLDISPKFETSKSLDFKFSVVDDKVLSDNLIVKAFYKGSDWTEVNLSKDSSMYSGSIQPFGESIDLKITASDGKNEIEYLFEPISKKSADVDLGLTASKTTANLGDRITFTGLIKDKASNQSIPQAYIKYLVDNIFYDFGRSKFFSFDKPGSFKTMLTVPLNYTGSLAEFAFSYLGTGIYNPQTQVFKIGISGKGPILNDFYIDPIKPTTETDVKLSSVWTNAVEVVLESDFEGKLKNYTTEKLGNIYSYTIKSSKLKENQAVLYRFLAKDSKNIWNNRMVVQTFTVKPVSKRITETNLTSFENNKAWGEKWAFSCSVLDSDNGKLDLSLLIKKPQGEWETKLVEKVSDTLSLKSINFEPIFDSSYIGSNQVKCSAKEGNVVLSESLEQTMSIERDDIRIEIVKGNGESISRSRGSKTELGFKVFDLDKNEYLLNLEETKILLTKDGSEPFDLELDCKFKKDICLVTFSPDSTFFVGNQTFQGSISDTSYRIDSSEKANLNIVGDLFVEISTKEAYKKEETVNIEIELTDDTNSIVEPDEFVVEYKTFFSGGQWSICSETEKVSSGKYICKLSAENLNVGKYDLRITATKSGYRELKEIKQGAFKIIESKFRQQKINKTDFGRGKYELPDLKIKLDLFFKHDAFDDDINITLQNENPVQKNLTGFSSFNKYLSIEPTEELRLNLSFVEIRIEYTDEEVNSNNFDESSLRLSFFNTSSNEWEVFDSPFGGVNETGNYVWANVSHLSDFAVGGKLEDGSSCTSNSDCSSGNCAPDYDGSGSWCSPSNNCAAEGFINYVSGSSTCYNSNKQTCSSGSWSQTTCSNGCSSGECIIIVPPQNATEPPLTGLPSGGGGGSSGDGSSGGSSGGGGSGGSVSVKQCTENDYICGEWSECLEGSQIRDCTVKQNVICKGDASPHTAQTCDGKKLDVKKEEMVKKSAEVKKVIPIEETKTIKSTELANKTKQLIYIGATLLIVLSLFITIWVRMN